MRLTRHLVLAALGAALVAPVAAWGQGAASQERTLPVNGIQIHYRPLGEGPPLVLLTLIHMATQQPERLEAMVLIGATTYFPEQARAIARRSHPDSLSAEEREEWGRCSARGDAQTREVLLQSIG
jgi:hypothetical protein